VPRLNVNAAIKVVLWCFVLHSHRLFLEIDIHSKIRDDLRLSSGRPNQDAQHPGDAWGPPKGLKRHTDDLATPYDPREAPTPERRPRGVAHRLFASPGGEGGEQREAGVSRRVGTAGTTGPEAWPDVREQKVALSLSLSLSLSLYISLYISIYL